MTSSVRILLPVALLSATALVAFADGSPEPDGKPSNSKQDVAPPSEHAEKPSPPPADTAAPAENSNAGTNATAPTRDSAKSQRNKQRPAWPPPPEIIS